MSEFEWSVGSTWLTIKISGKVFHIPVDEIRFIETREATVSDPATVRINMKGGDSIYFEGVLPDELEKFLIR